LKLLETEWDDNNNKIINRIYDSLIIENNIKITNDITLFLEIIPFLGLSIPKKL